MIWTRVWPKLGGSCLLVICYAAQCAAARACASCAVGSNSHRQFHFLIKMSFDNKAAQAAAAGSTVTPTTSPSTWAHPEMMLKRTAKRPSLETSIRHPTIVTIMCPMWQLCAAMMSWVGCLLKDSEIFLSYLQKIAKSFSKFLLFPFSKLSSGST